MSNRHLRFLSLLYIYVSSGRRVSSKEYVYYKGTFFDLLQYLYLLTVFKPINVHSQKQQQLDKITTARRNKHTEI